MHRGRPPRKAQTSVEAAAGMGGDDLHEGPHRACAVRKGGCFPQPVATGPRVLNSAPPMPLSVGHARVCRGGGVQGVFPG